MGDWDNAEYYDAMQEIERLRAENERLKEELQDAREAARCHVTYVKDAERWRAHGENLIWCLMEAVTRMERARRILTDDNPRPSCNWGMLETDAFRAVIDAAREE